MSLRVPGEQASTATLTVSSAPSADWDAFVDSIPKRPLYLRSGWTELAREVFGHETFFIEARDASGALVGVLPLVRQRGLLGNFATSIPFFNYGGALGIGSQIELALMERAQSLARDLGCSYLELRDVELKARDWRVRTDKVSMILQLPSSSEALGKQLGSKLRSQVKRADREGVRVRRGGRELLADFYRVFAQNMRDLGTPVYPVRFFESIMTRFADHVLIVVIDIREAPAAAGFLIFDGERAEIPWAACRADAKPLGANMKLYWEVLSTVIERKCTTFDFGRSTVNAGTYNFKKQWGAQPVQLHWHRWERNPKPAGEDDQSESWLLRQASALWRHLPLSVANVLGPMLSRSLPW